MPEIPGAREELENAAWLLRHEMQSLAQALEPGQHPGVTMLPEPAILDWREPLRHAYTASLDLVAKEHPSAAHAVRYGGGLLTALGWSVENHTGPAETRADARRDGYLITLCAVHPERGVSRYRDRYGIRGTTPHVLFHDPVEFVPPEPVVTAGTLPAGALLCYECDGLGWCPGCLGQGFTLDDDRRRQRCNLCFTKRICPICEGRGLKRIHAMNTWERRHYPELRSD
ncbi:hypothetical protein [Micromonospora sp. NPDC023956]|uniref:hypothetical protein n=1 Tax=Micromonospora sp. NPDC023956 TaxID=3155722 RepID=UPI0033E88452